MSGTDEKALIVAMQLLVQRLDSLPLQLAQNVGKTAEEILEENHKKGREESPHGWGQNQGDWGPAANRGRTADVTGQNEFLKRAGEWFGRRKEGAGETGGAMIGMLLKRFEAILGPLALFAQVLGSSLSGFQMLGKTVQLLVSLIAPVLMPVLVALSAAITAVFDVLFEKLLPAFETWFELVLAAAIPVVTFFIDMLMVAAAALKDFQDSLPGDMGSDLSWLTTMGAGKKVAGALDSEGDGGAPSSRDVVMRALRDVTASMKTSMGPRASMGGLDSVGRNIQMSALQSDPIEARMLKAQQMMVNLLERVVNNTTRGSEPVYSPAGRAAFDTFRETLFTDAVRSLPAPGGSS